MFKTILKDGETLKIVITGAGGQLGKELARKLNPNHTVYSLAKNELDITNQTEVNRTISRIQPEIIIHAAAYTAVDLCETEVKKALEVNGIGAGNVALAAENANSKMFYISSDYVFNGTKHTPYEETDTPDPVSVYGISKRLGEQLVLRYAGGTIVRTSWLYGHDGKNFVKTMLFLAGKNKEIKVIDDQIGSPTYTGDLSDTIIQLFSKKQGIYHVSNSGSCTWYEFARTIFEEAGFNPNLVLPTTTEEYGSKAPRPHYSVLAHTAMNRAGAGPIRPWRKALKEFIRKELTQ
ncbi:dTDP-4-dehydrorhamnose reductase [Metabacillus sp. 84]|uniref:dTDP-4-dehydrorhamnose reductase n=1 Tax=unclassified Metabacillus TaxID=2675274 RepID=UPI003CECD6CE